jgi:hypothetical protein
VPRGDRGGYASLLADTAVLPRVPRSTARPPRRPLLRSALEANLVTLAPLPVRVGLKSGEPMASVLSEALVESLLRAEAPRASSPSSRLCGNR